MNIAIWTLCLMMNRGICPQVDILRLQASEILRTGINLPPFLTPIARLGFIHCPPPLGSPRFARGTVGGFGSARLARGTVGEVGSARLARGTVGGFGSARLARGTVGGFGSARLAGGTEPRTHAVPPACRGNLKEGVAIETLSDEPEIPPATGSLWDDRAGSLYDDFKARRVGDLVTIVVVENTTASARANTAVQKSESASTSAGVGPLLNFLWPELGASGRTESNTQGNTARAGTLQTRITVQVVETFPNSVLRIEGRRTLKINEETQTLVFSGLVRIRDIRADNTVPSTAIANAEIYFEGKGIVGSRQREGILTRLFKIIF
jgi:flagellar L-ring protein precursor FlgH